MIVTMRGEQTYFIIRKEEMKNRHTIKVMIHFIVKFEINYLKTKK